MLLGWRRYFSVAAFLLLATPLVVGLVRPDSPAAVLKEGRRLAPAPRAPVDAAGWLALPAELDSYLKDHFGLRQVLIRAHTDLTKPMLGLGSDSVLVGRDGRMFYLGEEAVRQSAGLIVRDQRVADTVDLIAAMQGRSRPPRHPLPRRRAAECGDRLSGRSAGLGAEAGQADRIRSLSRGARGEGRHGGRPAAGHGRGAIRGAGLFPPRHALDGARGPHGL